MPLIKDRRTLAANSINYPLSGNQYEQLPFNARVEIAVVATAVTVDIAAYSGSDVLQQAGPPIVKATSPLYPDDFLMDDVAMAGEKISVQARETGNVATTVLETVAKITPL